MSNPHENLVSDEWVAMKIRNLTEFPRGDDFTPWRITLDACLDLRDAREEIARLREDKAAIYAIVTRALAEPPDGTATLVEIATLLEGDAARGDGAK